NSLFWRKYLSAILTLNDIIAENDEKLTANLDDTLTNCREIPFIAIDSIQVFFDILVPDGETLEKCEERHTALSRAFGIINDYKEVTSIVYVSLFDTHYYANGMKIQNLLSAYTIKQDMVISTRVSENIEKEKYPDAYLFPPKKGIEKESPVTGLDFTSLYFSIIMTYNLFIEKFIFDPKDANIPNEKKGIYPAVLEDLFNKRLKLKAHLISLGKKRQHLGKMISSAKERGKRILESLNLEYLSVCFDYDYWDLKQKALKIGIMGNAMKPSSEKKISKEAYWTEMFKIAINVIKKLHNQVNAYLKIKV
ncbi:6637_t:CDS:2, partial [Funneliformis geosporum]